MNTLVSMLRVPCHQWSGKYMAWWETIIGLFLRDVRHVCLRTDLSWVHSALIRHVRTLKFRIFLQQPVEGGLVRIELGLLMGWIQEPALQREDTRGLDGTIRGMNSPLKPKICSMFTAMPHLSAIDDFSKSRSMEMEWHSCTRT